MIGVTSGISIILILCVVLVAKNDAVQHGRIYTRALEGRVERAVEADVPHGVIVSKVQCAGSSNDEIDCRGDVRSSHGTGRAEYVAILASDGKAFRLSPLVSITR